MTRNRGLRRQRVVDGDLGNDCMLDGDKPQALASVATATTCLLGGLGADVLRGEAGNDTGAVPSSERRIARRSRWLRRQTPARQPATRTYHRVPITVSATCSGDAGRTPSTAILATTCCTGAPEQTTRSTDAPATKSCWGRPGRTALMGRRRHRSCAIRSGGRWPARRPPGPGTNTGEAAGDTYVLVENLFGQPLRRRAPRECRRTNAIYGQLGNDVCTGARGNDVLLGGRGKDRSTAAPASTGTVQSGNRRPARRPPGSGHQHRGGRGRHYVWGSRTSCGSRFDDVLLGNADANAVYGHLGNDVLHGRAGNDMLLGGLGRDRLDGGAGIDRAQYSQATPVSAPISRIRAPTPGEAEGDTYVLVESLFGSRFNDVLLGDADANAIRGHFGNDAPPGRAGNDRPAGRGWERRAERRPRQRRALR